MSASNDFRVFSGVIVDENTIAGATFFFLIVVVAATRSTSRYPERLLFSKGKRKTRSRRRYNDGRKTMQRINFGVLPKSCRCFVFERFMIFNLLVAIFTLALVFGLRQHVEKIVVVLCCSTWVAFLCIVYPHSAVVHTFKFSKFSYATQFRTVLATISVVLLVRDDH